MDLSGLRTVYENEGWFATIYLEGRAPGPDVQQEMRLRWQALRERLESAGASAPALDAVAATLEDEVAGEQHANGRVLVASDASVLMNEPWDAALGAGDAAHWTVLPELGAYAREAARSVRELVVVCDAQGAQIRRELVAEEHEITEQAATEIESGGAKEVHKPRGGALAHNRIQRRAEETLDQNAKEIATQVRKATSEFRPNVIVLAGEVQARTAVKEQLTDDLANLVIETDRGGRDEHASDESLVEELLKVAGEHSAARAEEYAERFQSGLAHENAVQGNERVAQAAETGAVETLLYEDGTPASREAFLLKVCAETSSAFALVPGNSELEDGVGAILRFPLPQR